MAQLPAQLAWLFPDVDAADVDTTFHRNAILTRVLERGGLVEVRWAQSHYGDPTILEFFRHVGSPEISPRTLSFWRAYFHASHETWADPTSSRATNPTPWRF